MTIHRTSTRPSTRRRWTRTRTFSIRCSQSPPRITMNVSNFHVCTPYELPLWVPTARHSSENCRKAGGWIVPNYPLPLFWGREVFLCKLMEQRKKKLEWTSKWLKLRSFRPINWDFRVSWIGNGSVTFDSCSLEEWLKNDFQLFALDKMLKLCYCPPTPLVTR